MLDDIAQELYGGTMELALLKLQEQRVLAELLEDLLDVLAMVGLVPGVDEDVINVHNHKAMEILPEHLVNEFLEDGGVLARPNGINRYS